MSGRHRGEAGMTIIELLAAMSVGLVVLMAAFTLVDRSFSASSEITDRVDALQRGRVAMEQITRQLRSQVCLGDVKDPIVDGREDSVTFHVDLSSGNKPVEQRRIFYNATAKTIAQEIRVGSGTYPQLTFPTINRTGVLLSHVQKAREGSTNLPYFRYYAFKEGGQPGELEQLVTPLNSTDVARVVMVRVAFASHPAKNVSTLDRRATTLENDVYTRTADPTEPKEGPRCL